MKKLGILLITGAVIVGCSPAPKQILPTKSVAVEKIKPVTVAKSTQTELFEVHKDGRIYFFYDKALYEDFLKLGHVAFQQSRIGGGSNGETLVFALTDADKKKLTGIPSVQIYEGFVPLFEPFYGEVVKDGRVYIFSDHKLMKSIRETGEAAFRYTDIGNGVNGETVVYVLTEANKKKHPAQMIAQYKQQHNL